jgi:hypothetical protein
MGASNAGHKLAHTAREFEQQIGKLIVRTRKHYLTRPPEPPAPPPAPGQAGS